jgi:hypothetical protein
MISCETNDLLQASACFKCIPAGSQEEVMIYLLGQIVDPTLTPQEMMDASACFKCIPKGMQWGVIAWLLCQTANGQIMNSNLLASGLAQLAGGTVTVNNANADPANVILLTYYSLDGNQATVSYGTIVTGTSFVITSSNSGDTNMVAWAILKP